MKRWIFALAALALVASAPLLSSRLRAQESKPPPLAVLSAPDWIGARPTAAALEGKVVVIDVFTVDCVNCQNVVPTLRSLYARDRDRGLEIVGIHSPETPPERERAYVVAALARQGITWPVAVDNGFALWHRYGIGAWPTELFVDRRGRLRSAIVGDSQDAAVEATVEGLLTEK